MHFFSGHAHNYQRFTRSRRDGTEIPYIVCGNGGHNVQHLVGANQPALRAPRIIQAARGDTDKVVLENYDDQDYGYPRVLVGIHSPRRPRVAIRGLDEGSRLKSDDVVEPHLLLERPEKPCIRKAALGEHGDVHVVRKREAKTNGPGASASVLSTIGTRQRVEILAKTLR